MDRCRDVWIDTSRPDLNVLCVAPLGAAWTAVAEGAKPVADECVVIGEAHTESCRADVDAEIHFRWLDAMASMPQELLGHALPLIREGYRIV